MKTTKTLCRGIATLLSLTALTGCTHSTTPQAANELRFNLSDISEVIISYDDEAITFYQAEGGELLVKEYMTQNKKAYYAKVKQDSNRIEISEGGKPFLKDEFTRYIEVFLPTSYTNNLTITTTDGDIDLSGISLALSALRMDSTKGSIALSQAFASDIHLSSTSGALNLGRIEGDYIKLETTSGDIACNELAGTVDYTSASGNLNVKSAVGSGSYKASNSGRLEVVYTNVMGDLTFFNKNDNIDVTIPKNLAFKFEATSKNGSISTTFDAELKVEEKAAHGTVGNKPTIMLKAKTNNGDIRVSQ